MSPIRPGRAVVPAVSAEALREASAALREAVRVGDAQLPAGPSSSAAAVVTKVHERMNEQAVMIWVAHDLNPRALSPKVKGFVQAQSWFQDLTPIKLK